MEDNEKYNIVLPEGTKELVIRHGEAKAPEKEPKPINISGVLHAPSSFLKARIENLDPINCFVKVDMNRGFIEFFIDAKNPYSDYIKGSLTRAKIVDDFGVNGSKTYLDKDLAKWFRKAAYYFADRSENEAAIRALMNFSATVSTVIENNQDNRGNVKKLLEKSVNSQVPERFTMKAPIFEGFEPLEFEVLIGAEATSENVKFFLESPELFTLEESYKRQLIDAEIEHFEEFGCAILYV